MQRFLSRMAISSASLLIATVIVGVAMLCLWAAVYLALAQSFTPPIAALLTGMGALMFGVAVVLAGNWIARMQTERKRERDRERTYAANEAAIEIGRMLGGQLRSLNGSEAQSAALAALIAGFAVGTSPQLRDFLRDLVTD